MGKNTALVKRHAGKTVSLAVATILIAVVLLVPIDRVQAATYPIPSDVAGSTDPMAITRYLNPDQLDYTKNGTKEAQLTATTVPYLYKTGDLRQIYAWVQGGNAGASMQIIQTKDSGSQMNLWRDYGTGFASFVVGFYSPQNFEITVSGLPAEVGQVQITKGIKVWNVYVKNQTGYGVLTAYIQASYPTTYYYIYVSHFSAISLIFDGVQRVDVGGGSSDPLIVAILGRIQNITGDMANLVASSSRQAQDILTLKSNLQGNATKVKNVEVAVEGLDQRVSRLESNAQNTTTARTCNLNTNLYPNVEICLSKQNGQYQAYTFYVNRAILGDNITIMVGTQTVAMQILDATLAYYTYTPSQAGTYTVTFTGSKSSWSMVVTVV